MKTKSFTVLLFASFTANAFAQFETNVPQFENGKGYKWGCALAINSTEALIGNPLYDSWGYATGNFFRNFGDITDKSLCLSIIPKYYINDNLLLRFEFGMTNIDLLSYYDNNANLLSSGNPTSHLINNQTIQQKIYRYSPSIQWILMKKKFIELYCGISAEYLHYSVMSYINHVETHDLPSNMLTGGFEDKATAMGGFASGIGAFAGFNIYLHKHISVGAEFSSALLYYKIGNTFSGVSTDLINPNPSTTQIYSYSTSSYKGFQFSKILSSFNLSVWF